MKQESGRGVNGRGRREKRKRWENFFENSKTQYTPLKENGCPHMDSDMERKPFDFYYD